MSGNTLYGIAESGGAHGSGTVFAINTDGTGFTNLYTFSPLTANTNKDGANPRGGLVLSGNTLFGTTIQGGAFGNGTLFSISLPAAGKHQSGGWRRNPDLAGQCQWIFTPIHHQFTNLVSPVSWTNVASPPVVGGLDTFTNPLSGTMQFFRLSQ